MRLLMFKWIHITKGTQILMSQMKMSLAKFDCKIKNESKPWTEKFHNRDKQVPEIIDITVYDRHNGTWNRTIVVCNRVKSGKCHHLVKKISNKWFSLASLILKISVFGFSISFSCWYMPLITLAWHRASIWSVTVNNASSESKWVVYSCPETGKAFWKIKHK